MENFVTVLRKDEEGFHYLIQNFPQISATKLKEGIFIGP